MSEGQGGSSFWVSYSDLSTGMMIVFMLVMVLMVALQKHTVEEVEEAHREAEVQRLEHQQAVDRAKKEQQAKQKRNQLEVSRVVMLLQRILETRPGFSKAVKAGLQKASLTGEWSVDDVTAQLKIKQDVLEFETGKSDLNDGGKNFLRRFTPAYICTLWQHETTRSSPGERVDPKAPGGVRRIMVTGSADLEGNIKDNRNYSRNRAGTVVNYMSKHLACLAGEDTTCTPGLKAADFPEGTSCKENPSAVWRYARERLWAVGAGDTQHCTFVLNQPDGFTNCDEKASNAQRKKIKRKNSDFRRVTFELEVTGDDMTGFLLHVLNLMHKVGGQTVGEGGQTLYDTADVVASECWKQPRGRYHGCEDFIDFCLKRPKPQDEDHGQGENLEDWLDRFCRGFWERAQEENTSLAEVAEERCRKPVTVEYPDASEYWEKNCEGLITP